MTLQNQTLERAAGRWHGILILHGIHGQFLRAKHGPCPMCGGRDRFRFDNKDGTGSWYCNACGAGYGITLLMKFKSWSFQQAVRSVEAVVGDVPRQEVKRQRLTSPEERRELVWKRWDGSRSLSPETNSRRYLKSRGIEHARIWDLRESTRGNMLALVRDLDGNPCQLQCTFLEDGRKAEVMRVRKFMQLPFPEGAAVRLLPQGSALGIAEGIETALSAAQMFSLPVWAALNTSLLRKWRPPAEVQRVYIFADHDRNYAGQAAAYHLAHRLASDDRLHVEVSVEIPLKAGHDWNDVLRSPND